MHGLDFGTDLFDHSIAIAFKTIPYFFCSFPELVFMAYNLLKLMTIRCFVVYRMYCKASLNKFSDTSVLTPSFLSYTLNAGVSSLYDRSNFNFA